MSKDKTVRLDQTFISSRPDLEVNIQMPGAYIIRDGKAVPDLNDEAMMEREKRNVKYKMDKMKEESKEENTNNQ